MSLESTLAAGPKSSGKGLGCTAGALLRSLPEAERAALSAMLGDAAWESQSIANVVRAEVGESISGQTFARHRRGGCSCDAQ